VLTRLRFSASERLLHWAFALGYLALLVTGLPLMVPAVRAAIRGYTPVVGIRLHLAAAVVWVMATLAVVAFADRRRLGATWRELARLGRADTTWLRRFPRWLVTGADERARLDRSVARFNAGQKLNALFTAVTAALLLVTGVALTPVAADGTSVAALLTGPATVGWWGAAHRWLTVLVLLPVAGHIYLAVVHPSTRPSLGGMLDGRVDAAWAAAHHPRWPGEPEEPGQRRDAA
jgi:formate dehydrogenase subunit gamma